MKSNLQLADQLVLKRWRQKVGSTPLIEFKLASGARIYAKREDTNRTGSIKDRAALAMIEQCLAGLGHDERERLKILEYSGGNLGVSLATLCEELKIPLHLVLPKGTPQAMRERLAGQGAQLSFQEEPGFWGVMTKAFELHQKNPDLHFLYQHQNLANVQAHEFGTGAEIILQLRGKRPTAWVASIGTGGTFAGVARALQKEKSYGSQVELHAVTPEEQPYGGLEEANNLPKYQGSGGLGHGRKQQFVEEIEASISRYWTVSHPDSIKRMVEMAAEYDLITGSSSAANFEIACRVAEAQGPSARVVTILPSGPSLAERQIIQQSQHRHAGLCAQG